MQPAPVFGKRARPPAPSRRPAVVAATGSHAAVFAAARAETAEPERALAVPRSFRAALIAGLVVGCCLAGLDATHAGETIRLLSRGLLSATSTPRLVPVVIMLGLYGGARAAATSLLVAHALLRRARLTSHVAYAAAGGATAFTLSALAAALVQAGVTDGAVLASHGLAIDAAAGTGAGFLYRVLAGARPADG